MSFFHKGYAKRDSGGENLSELLESGNIMVRMKCYDKDSKK